MKHHKPFPNSNNISSIKRMLRETDEMPPPGEPVRLIAEWKPCRGILAAWFTDYSEEFDNMYLTLIENLDSDETMYLICTSSSEVTELRNRILTAGLSLDRIVFMITDLDGPWMRDYGPIFVQHDGMVDNISVIDFAYYDYRPYDDAFNATFASDFGYNNYQCPLYWEGGNILTDGEGLIMSTEMLYENNYDLTETQVDNYVNQYLYPDRWITLQQQVDDGTGHIDMFCKFLDNHTAIVSEDIDGSSEDHEILDTNADLIDALSLSSSTGTFDVVRIPMWREFDWSYFYYNYYTYTNSLILNDKVFIPIYGSSYDATAISVYESLLPDFDVIPITCSEIIEYGGAIHCLTMQFPRSIDLSIFLDTYAKPIEYDLAPFPNPFNSQLTIPCHIGSDVRIFDIKGNCVHKAIAGGEMLNNGYGSDKAIAHVSWSPQNLPSGTYIVKTSSLQNSYNVLYVK